MMSVLKETYKKESVPALKEKFQYKSAMQVPRVEKVVLNIGIGDAPTNPKALEAAVEELKLITGQKPVNTISRQSIANFKIREGMNIGCKVTLRNEQMWEFIYKLTRIALPRVRDFRGIKPSGFDGRGNYNFSLKEQIVFPEIDVEKVDRYHGMNITVTTSARTNEEARVLLETLGFPFRKD
ncbi:MAG: 50S ribosomal protein L5 [Leptonema sp. (in: Bacteria)]|nr:50S ribosomal protein L5 [Leptonema sp. (in: bacteria)]